MGVLPDVFSGTYPQPWQPAHCRVPRQLGHCMVSLRPVTEDVNEIVPFLQGHLLVPLHIVQTMELGGMLSLVRTWLWLVCLCDWPADVPEPVSPSASPSIMPDTKASRKLCALAALPHSNAAAMRRILILANIISIFKLNKYHFVYKFTTFCCVGRLFFVLRLAKSVVAPNMQHLPLPVGDVC